MSIIQQIRDKAAWLVFGVIALSLIGFIFMDARTTRLFGGSRSTIVGSINGQKIEYEDFQRQVNAQEDQAKQQGYPMNESVQQNIRDGVWSQVVEEALLSDDYATLGLDVSDKEVNDMLVGANAIQQVRQAFTDPKTGIFDAQAAAAQINQLRNIYKAGPKKGADNARYNGARSFFEESVPQIIKMRLREKYTALLANSSYVPKWMIEKTNAENSQIASISYVGAPYFSIPDSSVKVSDAEIEEYVNAHSDQYKQDESRSIAYVTFDAAPNSADSARVRKQLTDLTADFVKANDPQMFFNRVGTEQPFYDGYIGKSRIQVPNKDSIFALQKGQTFGPYLDGGSYTVAKLIDVKTLPDSVHARHILVSQLDLRTRQPNGIDDSTAKKRIDSIKGLIERGERFDSVAARLSDDPGSKIKGGDLGYFTSDAMVKEFSDFSFNGTKGEKKVVKTQIGYHYIEILDQKNFEPAYKVAYLSRKIDASPETDQAAAGLANQFAAESRDAKAFDQSVQKGNLQKQFLPDVNPSEYTILGLGANRTLVRWIYDAKVGDVSEPYTIGDKYIVVLLTEINKKGTMSVTKARPRVEPILRNKKKTELLLKKLGTPASLDAAAAAAGQSVVRADSIRFSSAMLPNAGQEPKVVGVAFDKQLTGKAISPAISGNGGVFFVKVENVSALSNPEADLQQQRMMQEMRQRGQVANGLIYALRKLADIEDNRAKFY